MLRRSANEQILALAARPSSSEQAEAIPAGQISFCERSSREHRFGEEIGASGSINTASTDHLRVYDLLNLIVCDFTQGKALTLDLLKEATLSAISAHLIDETPIAPQCESLRQRPANSPVRRRWSVGNPDRHNDRLVSHG